MKANIIYCLSITKHNMYQSFRGGGGGGGGFPILIYNIDDSPQTIQPASNYMSIMNVIHIGAMKSCNMKMDFNGDLLKQQ